MARVARAKTKHYRCPRCRAIVPIGYSCPNPHNPVTVVNTLDDLRREFDSARLEQLADIGHNGAST